MPLSMHEISAIGPYLVALMQCIIRFQALIIDINLLTERLHVTAHSVDGGRDGFVFMDDAIV